MCVDQEAGTGGRLRGFCLERDHNNFFTVRPISASSFFSCSRTQTALPSQRSGQAGDLEETTDFLSGLPTKLDESRAVPQSPAGSAAIPLTLLYPSLLCPAAVLIAGEA